jgi:hypothetical protein
MNLHSWFDVLVTKHRHIWGPWIKMEDRNIKYNHRMIQGKGYTFQRTCTTCGEVFYSYKERKLDLTS